MSFIEERRDAERYRTEGGQALCMHGASGRHYVVDDFSQSGVRLRGGPAPPLGARVKTVLLVGGQGIAEVWGHVTRHADDGRAFGVRFEAESSMDEMQLEDLVARVVFDT